MSNSAVALMRRPAVRRRLQAELAALPQRALSYEELLAFFLDYGRRMAVDLCVMSDREASFADADMTTAGRLAAELLPQLAPDNPHSYYAAATMASCVPTAESVHTRYLRGITTALDVARQQGSDYYTAICGYQAAIEIEVWVAESAVQRGLPPPSAVLGWLQQAEAAHRHCKALLPKQWTVALDSFRADAAPAKAVLQDMQQKGDRWRRLTAAAKRELAAQDHGDDNEFEWRLKRLTCSECGKCAPQLRVCEAQYCR